MEECAFDLENADALQDLEENTVTKVTVNYVFKGCLQIEH